MARYKYVNLNRFPVIIPGPRGVGVTFDIGRASTDEWFGRFLGNKQLTKVPAGPEDMAQSQAGAQKTSVVPLAPPVPAPKIDMILQETTKDYTKKNGIYYCKHCAEFRTGSKRLFLQHLASYHGTGGEPELPAEPEPVPESVEPFEPPVEEAPTAAELPQLEPVPVVEVLAEAPLPVEQPEEPVGEMDLPGGPLREPEEPSGGDLPEGLALEPPEPPEEVAGGSPEEVPVESKVEEKEPVREGIACSFCDDRIFKSLRAFAIHLRRAHNLSLQEYKEMKEIGA